MKTQHQIADEIFSTAKVLEDLTTPSMLAVERHDIPLRDAAHNYAARLEMAADANDPGDADPAMGWNRVEHAARRLADTLRDIEQTPANSATISAALALATHSRCSAANWQSHPVGAPA